MVDQFDQEILALIAQEHARQREGINLIASENIVPEPVAHVLSSCLSNKYAEGTPGKRFYAGCRVIDQVELCAVERIKKLYEAHYANVQPHAGAQANLAAYMAVLKPGDTVLAMDFAAGGHLTHGHPRTIAAQLYNFISYGVHRQTELVDYDEVFRLAEHHRPKLIVAGASAYSRIIDWQKFSVIAKSVGALLMVDMAHTAGLVAAGIYPNPVPYADIVTGTTHKTLRGPRGGFILCTHELASAIDRAVMPGVQGGPFMQVIAAKAIAFKLAAQPDFVAYQKLVVANAQRLAHELAVRGYRIVSGGTDSHLFLVDLSSKKLTGRRAEELLAAHNIFVNRNSIPFDTQSPFVTSGIRIGTPFITSQGKTPEDMVEIADKIDRVLCA